jgi:hypothetical protein
LETPTAPPQSPPISETPVIKRKLKIKITDPAKSSSANTPITNKELAEIEKREYNQYLTNSSETDETEILYPTLNDPLFNVK